MKTSKAFPMKKHLLKLYQSLSSREIMKHLPINPKIVLTISLLFFFWLTLSHAWICDDFLITVRSILNFIHGFGPVYNINERVQSYTHPLWFFILSGVMAVTKEIFYSIVLTSVLFSFLAVLLMSKAHGFEKNPFSFIAFVLFITFSSAFMDYTSSGLENPLGYLLFSGLVWCFYKNHYFYLPLLAALLFLTRYDYLFIFLPFLIFYLIQPKQWKGKLLSFSISGFIVLSWLVFSLYYYGSLFPNTYYAKTIGYDIVTTIENSIMYYKATWNYDFLTLLPILFCFIFIRSQLLNKKDKFLVFSVLPYLLYIFWIGGDFMMGRFLGTPFLVVTPVFIKICFSKSLLKSFINLNKPLKIVCLLILFLSLFFVDYKRLPIVEKFKRPDFLVYTVLNFRVVDEIVVFQDSNFLFPKPNARVQQINEAYNQWKTRKEFKAMEFCGYAGAAGLLLGKEGFLVDYCGLSDPLLSRLKLPQNNYVPALGFKPGHLKRHSPLGYMSTIMTKGKSNFICDKDLKEYWEIVKNRTRRPPSFTNLWSHLKSSLQKESLVFPDFKETLKNDPDCKKKLQGLYLQKLDREDLDKKRMKDALGSRRWSILARVDHKNHTSFGMQRLFLSDHVILDLSARINWGSTQARCFEIILDGWNDFYLKFMKDERIHEEVHLNPKKRSSMIKKSTRDNYSKGWHWNVYRFCLTEPLNTDHLVIDLNCEISSERFCYIHSLSEMASLEARQNSLPDSHMEPNNRQSK